MLPNSAAIAASDSVQDDAPVAGIACVVAPATAPAGDTAVGATGTGPAESTDPEDGIAMNGVAPDGVPEESVVGQVTIWSAAIVIVWVSLVTTGSAVSRTHARVSYLYGVVVTVRFWTKVVASHTLKPSIQASNTTSAGGGASMYDSE